MNLNTYIEIRKDKSISNWFKKEAINYEFRVLLDCCSIFDSVNYDTPIDNLYNHIEPNELYVSKTYSNLHFVKSYKINSQLPMFFSISTDNESKEMYIGEFRVNEVGSDELESSFIYTIYDKFIEFNKVDYLNDDPLYRDIYGLTVNITHKRLFYFINKISKSLRTKFIAQLPDDLKKEYIKIFI